MLLGDPGYDCYILGVHEHVHEQQAFKAELFDRWYLLFVASVDEGWRGDGEDRDRSEMVSLNR